MSDSIETEKIQIENGRNKKGQFAKGSVHNPKGNTHCKDIAGLIDALEDKSKREGYEDFNALVADRAVKYKEVLIALIKKIYPEQSPQPIINIYTQIWNGIEKKARDVEADGRVHLRDKTEVPA